MWCRIIVLLALLVIPQAAKSEANSEFRLVYTNDSLQKTDQYDSSTLEILLAYSSGLYTVVGQGVYRIYSGQFTDRQAVGDPVKYAGIFSYNVGLQKNCGRLECYVAVGAETTDSYVSVGVQNMIHDNAPASPVVPDKILIVPDQTHLLIKAEIADSIRFGNWTVRSHFRFTHGYQSEFSHGTDIIWMQNPGGRVAGWNPTTHASHRFARANGWFASVGYEVVIPLKTPHLPKEQTHAFFPIVRGELGYQGEDGFFFKAGVSAVGKKFSSQAGGPVQFMGTISAGWKFDF